MISFSAALLIVAAQASPAEAQAISKDYAQRYEAYVQCFGGPKGEISKLPATVTPEEGAKIVLKACGELEAAMRQAREKSFAAVFSPKEAAKARKGAKNETEESMADVIRTHRAQAANAQCIDSQVAKLDAAVTAEAGAETVFNACAAQRLALLKAMLSNLEKTGRDDEWSLALVANYRAQIANDPKEAALAKQELANRINMKRKGPPAPAPAN